MNKILGSFLSVLALVLMVQVNAFAENAQGTVTEINTGAHNFSIVPPHDVNEPAENVKITTAPGVQYTGVDAFEGLQIGDFVKIQSSGKSRSGGAVEATSIERTATADVNTYRSQATQVIVETNSAVAPLPNGPVTAVTTIPAQTVTTTLVPAENSAPAQAVVSDVNTSRSEVTTTTTTTY